MNIYSESKIDYLIELKMEDWEEMRDTFAKDWPRSITGYYLLEMQRNWIRKGLKYGFTAYTPYGSIENSLVALNEKKDFYELILLCPSDDTSNLQTALVQSSIIDWTRRIIVPFASDNVVECLKAVTPIVGATIERFLPSNTFLVAKGSPSYEISKPEEVTLKPLSAEVVTTININWPHRYATSEWYFEQIIKSDNSFGLYNHFYNTHNKELMSWLLINESGTLCHLYTIEKYRKKGLAEILLKHVSNKLLQEGKDVFAFCVKSNESAFNLYKKLNFTMTNDVTWCYQN